ncbi:hypothetical protein [Spongiactinospora sp. 9N601]|uniref:hypothetical protein n=1 Tax=Spongiactinospora sp. 9N601 TaxID=3375149 RepID=UPI00378BA2FB
MGQDPQRKRAAMVVGADVALAIRGWPRAQVAVFVAGCAERMVQIFTVLHGGDPARNGDVDIVVQLMADLWDLRVPAGAFRGYVASLEGFRELKASEEEVVRTAEVFSFYSVLVLRYSALYRAGADVEDALRCAHVCLTAMGQLDQNLMGAGFASHEADSQSRFVQLLSSGELSVDFLSRISAGNQAIGGQRAAVICGWNR